MSEAEINGKFFILDSEEGNDFIDPNTGWYVEDLSGWYIFKEDKERLLQSRDNNTAYTDFSDEYVFAKWSKSESGKPKISFVRY